MAPSSSKKKGGWLVSFDKYFFGGFNRSELKKTLSGISRHVGLDKLLRVLVGGVSTTVIVTGVRATVEIYLPRPSAGGSTATTTQMIMSDWKAPITPISAALRIDSGPGSTSSTQTASSVEPMIK